jgi:hypothetical protein
VRLKLANIRGCFSDLLLAVIVIADSVRPVDVTVLPPELSGVYR